MKIIKAISTQVSTLVLANATIKVPTNANYYEMRAVCSKYKTGVDADPICNSFFETFDLNSNNQALIGKETFVFYKANECVPGEDIGVAVSADVSDVQASVSIVFFDFS
jgi:hypothetical protein